MKTYLSTLILLITMFSNAHAMITKQTDEKNNCELYSVLNKVRNDAGELVLSRDLVEGEEIIDNKTHYGLELKKLEIDFDKREARFEIFKQVTFGVNRNLIDTDVLASISADNQQFSMIINQINRKLFIMNSICVDRDNQVIYAE